MGGVEVEREGRAGLGLRVVTFEGIESDAVESEKTESVLRGSEDEAVNEAVNDKSHLASPGPLCFLCQRPALLHCPSLPALHFCSPEHQGLHCDVQGCRPYRLAKRSGSKHKLIIKRVYIIRIKTYF